MLISKNQDGINQFGPGIGFVVEGDTPNVGEIPAGSTWVFNDVEGEHHLTLVDLPEDVAMEISEEEYDEFLKAREISFVWDYSGNGHPEPTSLKEAVEFMFVVAKDLVNDKDFRRECWPDASPFLPGKEKEFVEAFRKIMTETVEGLRVLYG